jgi:hypothetical protein
MAEPQNLYWLPSVANPPAFLRKQEGGGRTPLILAIRGNSTETNENKQEKILVQQTIENLKLKIENSIWLLGGRSTPDIAGPSSLPSRRAGYATAGHLWVHRAVRV